MGDRQVNDEVVGFHRHAKGSLPSHGDRPGRAGRLPFAKADRRILAEAPAGEPARGKTDVPLPVGGRFPAADGNKGRARPRDLPLIADRGRAAPRRSRNKGSSRELLPHRKILRRGGRADLSWLHSTIRSFRGTTVLRTIRSQCAGLQRSKSHRPCSPELQRLQKPKLPLWK